MTRSLQECMSKINSLKKSVLKENDDFLTVEKENLMKNVGKWMVSISYTGDDETYFLRKDGNWELNDNPCGMPDYYDLNDYLLANSPEHLIGIINRLKQNGNMKWPNVHENDVFTDATPEGYYEVYARIIPPLHYNNYTDESEIDLDIMDYCQNHYDECYKDITADVNYIEDMKSQM